MAHNPRSLESLGSKLWSFRSYDGMTIWGWSRDWNKRSPWSYDEISLPYFGITKRRHKTMTSLFLTIGPAMVGVHWIKPKKGVYPNIERACLEIAYDNGAINRRETKQAMVDVIGTFLELQEDQIDLDSIEIWLGMLGKESFEILCCGDVSDIPDTMADAPKHTTTLLDNWFDFM